jgi:pilus biogenesis lipoprotein CpaD
MSKGMQKTMTGEINSRKRARLAAVRAALLLGTLALAAGCETIERADRFVDRHWQVESNTLPPDRVAVAVRRSQASISLAFAPRSAALGRDQRDALARFVAQSGAIRGDQSVIAMSPAGGRALAERRVQAIARELHRRGLRVARSFGPGEPDLAVVTLSRLVAIPPDCPQWQELIKNSTADEYKPKFGCITASSLAATVHRPQDLIQGRPSGRSDGPVMERGIQQLREGKFDPPVTAAGTGSPQSGAPAAK